MLVMYLLIALAAAAVIILLATGLGKEVCPHCHRKQKAWAVKDIPTLSRCSHCGKTYPKSGTAHPTPH